MVLGKKSNANGNETTMDKNFFGEVIEEDDEVIVESIMAGFGAGSDD